MLSFLAELDALLAAVAVLNRPLVSGEVLVATVLSIPTIGPLMLQGVMNQDTQVAGAIVMILSTLTAAEQIPDQRRHGSS